MPYGLATAAAAGAPADRGRRGGGSPRRPRPGAHDAAVAGARPAPPPAVAAAADPDGAPTCRRGSGGEKLLADPSIRTGSSAKSNSRSTSTCLVPLASRPKTTSGSTSSGRMYRISRFCLVARVCDAHLLAGHPHWQTCRSSERGKKTTPTYPTGDPKTTRGLEHIVPAPHQRTRHVSSQTRLIAPKRTEGVARSKAPKASPTARTPSSSSPLCSAPPPPPPDSHMLHPLTQKQPPCPPSPPRHPARAN